MNASLAGLSLASLLSLAGAAGATEVPVTAISANQITTQDARLEIKMQGGQPLPVGTHTFELVVTDDSGNESNPARTRVIVRDSTPPVAVLRGPKSVSVGQSIVLDASKSADQGGRIVRYSWRLID